MPDLTVCAVRPVILSGGGGTRLWPLSRAGAPKQFLPIVGDDSLLQATAKRCRGEPFLAPLIVTGEEQRFFVLDQLEASGIESGAVILEPAPRNTAPAVSVAALWSLQRGDDLILVMPSDHVIRDVSAMHQAVAAATPAALAGAIVTFGIEPSSPNSGYGYIKAGPSADAEVVRRIERFIEKPDHATAVNLLKEGECYWNSGMFLMRPSLFIEELERFAPAIAAATRESMKIPGTDRHFIRPDPTAFTESPSDSIDYSVMERTDRARVLPVDFGWSDVGSWDAVREVLDQDSDGNVLRGDVRTMDVRNSLIRCEADMTIAVVGMSDIVCIVTDDAAFIAPLDRAQDNKKLVDAMRADGDPRANEPAQVYRPWGTYQTMDRGARFQTRRVIVKPGAQQSLQLHRNRSEHFVIVSGEAEITIDGVPRELRENESAFVPAGMAHRIRNIGSEPLHIIEVQSGSDLSEDDIVRLEDAYGRG